MASYNMMKGILHLLQLLCSFCRNVGVSQRGATQAHCCQLEQGAGRCTAFISAAAVPIPAVAEPGWCYDNPSSRVCPRGVCCFRSAICAFLACWYHVLGMARWGIQLPKRDSVRRPGGVPGSGTEPAARRRTELYARPVRSI